MDPKNQNLKPELKEIYDKIMSTPVNPGTPTQTPPAPASPGLQRGEPPVEKPVEPVMPASPSYMPPPLTMPSVAEPKMAPPTPPMTPEPPMTAAPPTPTPTPIAPQDPIVAAPPEMSAPIGTTPPMSNKGFVFSGGETAAFTPTGSDASAAPKKGFGKVSGKLLTVLIIAFVATYTVIWLKLFNFF